MSLPNIKKENKIVAYIVSDVHLNNRKINIGDVNDKEEESERKIFKNFLFKVNLAASKYTQVKFILNGDILDLTGSWFFLPVPWDDDVAAVEKCLLKVIDEILSNNYDIFMEFKNFIKNDNTEIIYVIGNHDGLFELFPSAREFLIEKLFENISTNPSDKGRFKFVTSYEDDALGLYAEHGHRLDPYNFYDSKIKPPLGDVLDVLIVNKFIETTENRLLVNGYSADIIVSIKNRLHDIKYIRPLILLPLWIETIAKEQQNNKDSVGKPEPIEQILRTTIIEIIRDKSMAKFIVQKLRVPMFVIRLITKLMTTFTQILPLISYICTRLVRRTHSNNFQVKVATKLSISKPYKFICFGHTHIPMMKAITPDSYYFNTASWTPVINLFKYNEYELTTEELLNPDEHFRKIERSGIVKIEKDLTIKDAKPVFSIEMRQSGMV